MKLEIVVLYPFNHDRGQVGGGGVRPKHETISANCDVRLTPLLHAAAYKDGEIMGTSNNPHEGHEVNE